MEELGGPFSSTFATNSEDDSGDAWSLQSLKFTITTSELNEFALVEDSLQSL